MYEAFGSLFETSDKQNKQPFGNKGSQPLGKGLPQTGCRSVVRPSSRRTDDIFHSRKPAANGHHDGLLNKIYTGRPIIAREWRMI